MNPVPIGCICPGKPHEGDTVTLKDPLPFASAMTIRQTLGRVQRDSVDRGEAITVDEYTAILSELYLLYGIAAWTLTDAEGKPVAVTKASVTGLLLADLEAASEVADVADDLYTKKVILPLLPGASISLPGSLTDGSTSATNGTGTTPPKPSRPSSTSTIPTADTAPMTT